MRLCHSGRSLFAHPPAASLACIAASLAGILVKSCKCTSCACSDSWTTGQQGQPFWLCSQCLHMGACTGPIHFGPTNFEICSPAPNLMQRATVCSLGIC
eukprot:1141333-Pelagomonas_calceolata.AAC.2